VRERKNRLAYIVEKEKDGKIYYYRNLKHASHFTDKRNEAEIFKSYNLANWASKAIDGKVEEINILGYKKNK
jgi:hypothetical protein